MAKMGKDKNKKTLEGKEPEEAAITVESKVPDTAKSTSKLKRRGKKKKATKTGQKVDKQKIDDRETDDRKPDDESQQALSEGDSESSAIESSEREPSEERTDQSEITGEIPNAPHNSYVSQLTRADRSKHGQSANGFATNLQTGEQLSLGMTGTEEEESGEQAARRHLKSIVESLIFVSDKPLSVAQIRKTARAKTAEVTSILKELVLDYQGRGIELVEVGGGYIFRSAPRSASFVRDLVAQRPVRLSQAQLETLSIAAYRQPVTRPEIEEIRGVDTGSAIKVLLDRGLLKMLGRKDEPGRPLLYGTTPFFLEFFGMNNLKDLPTLREFSDLNEENRELFKRKTGESLEEAKDALSSASIRLDQDSGASEQRGDAEVDEEIAGEEIQESKVSPDEDLATQKSELGPLTDREAIDKEEESRERDDDFEDRDQEYEQERVEFDYDDV